MWWQRLRTVVLDHVPVSSVAWILGVAWHTAHTAVAELGRELLIGHLTGLDGVQLTVNVDLTPVSDRSGPARLLDMVAGLPAACSRPGSTPNPTAFADEGHLPVEVGWCVYQDVIADYRDSNKTLAKAAMT